MGIVAHAVAMENRVERPNNYELRQINFTITKVEIYQGSFPFKSHTIFLEHKIFIRVMMKIKSAIYIEFNILTTFMESRFISHLFNKVRGQSVK